jgi:hypothetical protein
MELSRAARTMSPARATARRLLTGTPLHPQFYCTSPAEHWHRTGGAAAISISAMSWPGSKIGG